jgi:FK506-binding protein 1
MGVTKTTTSEGNGPIPQKGQTVTIQYTGFLKDPSKPDNKGEKYVVISARTEALRQLRSGS